MTRKIIGLFGGAFDPIHNGHIQVAKLVTANYPEISEICFIPSFGNRRHKIINIDFERRFQMVLGAIEGFDNFKADAVERAIYASKSMAKETDTNVYMLDVIKAFKYEYPKYDFILILGADSYNSIELWHKYKEVLKTPIIVTTREHSNEDFKQRDNVKFLYSESKDDISSTLIRKALAGLNKNTLRYILDEKLYEIGGKE